MPPDLLPWAQYGGFAVLGLAMLWIARAIYNAFKNGDVVTRAVYEREVARGDLLAVQLARNNETLAAHTIVQEKLAKSVAALAAAERAKKKAGQG